MTSFKNTLMILLVLILILVFGAVPAQATEVEAPASDTAYGMSGNDDDLQAKSMPTRCWRPLTTPRTENAAVQTLYVCSLQDGGHSAQSS